MLHPTGIALDYRDAIRHGPLADALNLVRDLVIPALPQLAASASRVATDAADVGQVLDAARAKHAAKWTRDRFAAVVQPHASNVELFQKKQLNNVLRAIVSVDVVGAEPWIAPAIAEFTRENVSLIKTIPNVFFDDVEKNLARQIGDGVRWEEMVTGIEGTYNLAAQRAELIARDQAGKFYGDLNRVRQVDLGITKSVWCTSNDNRVRDEHAAREGVSFEWSEGIDGETPGEPVLCRCYGAPDIAALLED